MTLQSRLAALVTAIGADIKTVSNKVRVVRAVSTANVALTGSGGGFGRMDDVAIDSGDRVLLVGQTNQTQNGVYTYTVNGLTGGWSFDRSSDFDQSSEIVTGQIVNVMEGTLHAGAQYIVNVDSPTIGSTPITFVAVAGKSIVPIVSALPTGATDGDEIYFQTAAMAADGIAWHLRYRAKNPDGSTNTSPYKWEWLGGSELNSEWLPRITRANLPPVTYSNGDAHDPTFALPLAGDYRAWSKATMIPVSACVVSQGIKVGATEPVVNVDADMAYSIAGAPSAMTLERTLLNVASGTVLAQRYYQNQLTMNVELVARSMQARPIRVG